MDRGKAAIGVLFGVVVIGWMSLSPFLLSGTNWKGLQNTLHTKLTIVMGTLTIFIIGFLLTGLISMRHEK